MEYAGAGVPSTYVTTALPRLGTALSLPRAPVIDGHIPRQLYRLHPHRAPPATCRRHENLTITALRDQGLAKVQGTINFDMPDLRISAVALPQLMAVVVTSSSDVSVRRRQPSRPARSDHRLRRRKALRFLGTFPPSSSAPGSSRLQLRLKSRPTRCRGSSTGANQLACASGPGVWLPLAGAA